MKTEKPTPKTEPEQKTTQANQQSAEGEADEPASPPVVQPLNAESGNPKPAESYNKTDRKQDETLQTIAKQTEWEKKQADALDKQTGLMEKQTVWMRRQAIWTAALTVLTLGVLIYHGILMRGQWQSADDQTKAMKAQTDIMSGQLKSMESDSAQTQQLIDQNRDLVAHAGEQANALKDSLAETRKAADAAVTQADASVASAKAAEDSARYAGRTVEATREATYTANRAYFTLRQIHPPTIAGNALRVQITWENDGNSPARVLDGRVNTELVPRVPMWSDCDPRQGSSASGITVQPRTARTQRFNSTVEGVGLKGMESGQLKLVVCGYISYETLGGNPPPFRFCTYWDKDNQDYLQCKGGQESK
jgi:hypothetical protein